MDDTVEAKVEAEVELIPMHVVNLDRREDRWEKFNEQDLSGLDVRRLSATDGKEINISPILVQLIGKEVLTMKRGALGDALSHIRLWIKLLFESEERQRHHLIVEDDILIVNKFASRMRETLKELDPLTYDICFIGYCVTASEYSRYRREDVSIQVAPLHQHPYYSGTFGYIISRQGIINFLRNIIANKLRTPIDTYFLNCTSASARTTNQFKIMCTFPLLGYCEAFQQNANVDTDIQRDGVSIRREYNLFILEADRIILRKTYLANQRIIYCTPSLFKCDPRLPNIIICSETIVNIARRLAQQVDLPYLVCSDDMNNLQDFQEQLDRTFTDYYEQYPLHQPLRKFNSLYNYTDRNLK